MRFRNSKALCGLAAAGILALMTSVSMPANAQDDQPQTTTQIMNACNTNTGDMAQLKACLQAAGQILQSALPGQYFNPLLNILGDKISTFGQDPIDPDVSTPPAPDASSSNSSSGDGSDQ